MLICKMQSLCFKKDKNSNLLLRRKLYRNGDPLKYLDKIPIIHLFIFLKPVILQDQQGGKV